MINILIHNFHETFFGEKHTFGQVIQNQNKSFSHHPERHQMERCLESQYTTSVTSNIASRVWLQLNTVQFGLLFFFDKIRLFKNWLIFVYLLVTNSPYGSDILCFANLCQRQFQGFKLLRKQGCWCGGLSYKNKALKNHSFFLSTVVKL